MKKSIFDPANQEHDISSKIVAGLGRISEAFKVLLWEKAKQLGLSPIQIQILIFIAYHKQGLGNVSHLAKEFNVTKPTISDAVRILDKKGLINKNFSQTDHRRYVMELSDQGRKIVSETEHFANPLKYQLDDMGPRDLEQLFGALGKLIYQLNRHGILSVQRTCYGCKFYSKTKQGDFCNLLNKPLLVPDIRIDCPEYEAVG